jgi:hypothetical protein
VSACVLLKMSLNSGNRFCIYLVDLFAVSLVSWICMIAVLFRELFIKLCRFGNDVLSDDAFQIIMFVSCSVLVFILVIGVGAAVSGGGCEYSLMFSKHLSVSVINWFGRKGNSFLRVIDVGVVAWLWMNSYSFVCIEF